MPARSNSPRAKSPRAGLGSRPPLSRTSSGRRPSGAGRGFHTGFHFSFGNRRPLGRRGAGCIGCLLPVLLALLVGGALVAVL
jgi:hypothetical protein